LDFAVRSRSPPDVKIEKIVVKPGLLAKLLCLSGAARLERKRRSAVDIKGKYARECSLHFPFAFSPNLDGPWRAVRLLPSGSSAGQSAPLVPASLAGKWRL
jgi:hypothetical protein